MSRFSLSQLSISKRNIKKEISKKEKIYNIYKDTFFLV